MAYSDDAKKRGRSRRVGSYQQGQEGPQSAQPVQGQNKQPMFNDTNKPENFAGQQIPTAPNKAESFAGGGNSAMINEDTSGGTFKTEMSECVWKGIINGETFKDAKKKCNG